ncbi:MAG: outer membrane beta-barrel protein [Gemmatimonadaceae bacterium]
MKRFAIAATVIGLAAGASTAHAQEASSTMVNRTRGFMLNGHLQISPPLTVKGGDFEDPQLKTKLGFGGGIQVGYGITSLIMPYINLDVSKQDSDVDGLEGDFGVSHVELGARFNFQQGGAVVPYANVGVGARGLGADVDVGEGMQELRLTGGHVVVGGGVQYFFKRKLAFDAGVQVGFGKFDKLEFDGDEVDVEGSDNVVSSRIKLGLSWFPQAR